MPSLFIFIHPFSLSRLFTSLTRFFFFSLILLFSFSLVTPHLLPSRFIFLNSPPPPPLFHYCLLNLASKTSIATHCNHHSSITDHSISTQGSSVIYIVTKGYQDWKFPLRLGSLFLIFNLLQVSVGIRMCLIFLLV
jgi:hypothetical protein